MLVTCLLLYQGSLDVTAMSLPSPLSLSERRCVCVLVVVVVVLRSNMGTQYVHNFLRSGQSSGQRTVSTCFYSNKVLIGLGH